MKIFDFWKLEAPFMYEWYYGDLRCPGQCNACTESFCILRGLFETPGSSRRLFEIKELLKKSSKFVKIDENRLGIEMGGAFFYYGCKHDPLWLFGIGMTLAPFLYILGCMWAKEEPLAPFDTLWTVKKASKMPIFVKKSPIFMNHAKHRRLLLVSVLLGHRGASGTSKSLWVK